MDGSITLSKLIWITLLVVCNVLGAMSKINLYTLFIYFFFFSLSLFLSSFLFFLPSQSFSLSFLDLVRLEDLSCTNTHTYKLQEGTVYAEKERKDSSNWSVSDCCESQLLCCCCAAQRTNRIECSESFLGYLGDRPLCYYGWWWLLLLFHSHSLSLSC